MKTPFEILSVADDSNDQTIKQGYLQQIKKFPPERFPEKFQRTREAYEKIRTKKDRLNYLLFDISIPKRDDMVADIMEKFPRRQPTLNHIEKLLVESIWKRRSNGSGQQTT